MLWFCISSSVEQKDISNPYVAINPQQRYCRKTFCDFSIHCDLAMVLYTTPFLARRFLKSLMGLSKPRKTYTYLSLSFELNSRPDAC